MRATQRSMASSPTRPRASRSTCDSACMQPTQRSRCPRGTKWSATGPRAPYRERWRRRSRPWRPPAAPPRPPAACPTSLRGASPRRAGATGAQLNLERFTTDSLIPFRQPTYYSVKLFVKLRAVRSLLKTYCVETRQSFYRLPLGGELESARSDSNVRRTLLCLVRFAKRYPSFESPPRQSARARLQRVGTGLLPSILSLQKLALEA